MIVVGIAGPAGSGKSTVCRLLSRRPGFVHLDCDRLAHAAYAPGGPAYGAVVSAFGEGILRPDGTVDRRALAARALADPAALRRLEAIVHPVVAAGIREAIARERARGTEVLLVEGALLFTSPHVPQGIFDLRVWLEAPEGVRRKRLLSAGVPAEEVERRLRAQRGLRPPPGVHLVDAARSPEEVARSVLVLIEGMGGTRGKGSEGAG